MLGMHVEQNQFATHFDKIEFGARAKGNHIWIKYSRSWLPVLLYPCQDYCDSYQEPLKPGNDYGSQRQLQLLSVPDNRVSAANCV